MNTNSSMPNYSDLSINLSSFTQGYHKYNNVTLFSHGGLAIHGKYSMIGPKLYIEFSGREEDNRINNYFTNYKLIQFANYLFKSVYFCGVVLEEITNSNYSTIVQRDAIESNFGQNDDGQNVIYFYKCSRNPIEFVHEVIHALLHLKRWPNEPHIDELELDLGRFASSHCSSLNVFADGVPGLILDLRTQMQIHGIDPCTLAETGVRAYDYFLPSSVNNHNHRSIIYLKTKEYCNRLYEKGYKPDDFQDRIMSLLFLESIYRIQHNFQRFFTDSSGLEIAANESSNSKYLLKKKKEDFLEPYKTLDFLNKEFTEFLQCKFKDEATFYSENEEIKFVISDVFKSEEDFVNSNVEFVKSQIKQNLKIFNEILSNEQREEIFSKIKLKSDAIIFAKKKK